MLGLLREAIGAIGAIEGGSAMNDSGLLSRRGFMAASLADQQLAGLLMLVVCPASYLAAGVAIAARWVFETDGSSWSDRESEQRRDAAARNAA